MKVLYKIVKSKKQKRFQDEQLNDNGLHVGPHISWLFLLSDHFEPYTIPTSPKNKTLIKICLIQVI